MSGNSKDGLKDLLRRDTERLALEALQNSGRLSAGQISSVARLARLAEIHDSLQPRARWTAPLVLALTLACASALVFAHVRRTEIELDLRLAEAGLRMASGGVLLDGADLQALGVAGAGQISIRTSSDWPGLDLAAAQGQTLNLQVALGDPARAHITLAAVEVPAGTTAWIQPRGGHNFRLVLQGGRLEVQASLMGPLRLAGEQVGAQRVEFKRPRPAVFRVENGTLSLDLTVDQLASIRFARQFKVDRLLFYSVEHSQKDDRRVSSVISGSLFLEELNGREEKLRPGQELRFELSEGVIRAIQLQPDSLNLQVHGFADELETGSYRNPRHLMPTWIEWLQARHGLSLLWGSALYLFGVVSVALRWLRVRI